jgi:transposase
MFDLGDMKEATIYKYLGKCAGRLKATRPCNPKKDPAAESAFRATLADRMEKLDLPPAAPVRLWVYDEMRYGLHPLTRKMWCLRGVRAIAPSRRRYQNGYLYGALEVGGGGSEFLFTPTLNKEWDLGFLSQIAAHDPEAVHVVIGDGAGFHHKKNEGALPEKVRIITLPAYSPELNPVEKLWDIVKDGICNRDWADLDELEEKITERIKPYWEDARRVTRLIGNGYLLSELNAIWKTDFRQFN